MWLALQPRFARLLSVMFKCLLTTLLLLFLLPKSFANNWSYYGDFRYDYLQRDAKPLDKDNLWRTRLRLGIKQQELTKGAWDIRLANNYHSIGKNSHIDFSLSYPLASEMDKSFTTVDRLNWQKKWPNWHVRIGRFTHRSVLKGNAGLSLDKKNTIGTVVDWTDGLELQHKLSNDWNLQFLWQYEAASRTSSIRRAPLDFSSSSSRASYHFQLEKTSNSDFWLQRNLTLNYYPQALPIKANKITKHDYRTLNGKLVIAWPLSQGKWLLGTELAYLIDRPSTELTGIDISANNTRLSFQSIIGWKDFIPNHKLEFNYSETSAGWLISPNFPANSRLKMLTYLWIKSNFFLELTAIQATPLETYANTSRNIENRILLFRLNFSF